MNGSEKNHVPITRELIAVSGKPGVELRSQHGIVFKNQNARPRCGASLLNRGEVTAQTAIGAGIIVPKSWDCQLAAVHRRKANYALEIVFGKLGLHLPPTICALVQVDANLVGKEIVKLHEFCSSCSAPSLTATTPVGLPAWGPRGRASDTAISTNYVRAQIPATRRGFVSCRRLANWARRSDVRTRRAHARAPPD